MKLDITDFFYFLNFSRATGDYQYVNIYIDIILMIIENDIKKIKQLKELAYIRF